MKVLVCACIEEGIDTGGLIVSTLGELDFDKRHVGILLAGELKAAEASRLWHRDPDGRYHLPAEASAS